MARHRAHDGDGLGAGQPAESRTAHLTTGYLLAERVTRRARLRRVGVVLLGSTVGQGLVIGSTPVLTRYYDPAAFGLLAVFTAISGVIATAITMRLDLAVSLPRTRREAAALAHLAVLVGSVASVTLGLFGGAIGGPVGRLFSAPLLAKYWWLLAAATVLLAFDQLMLGWMVREHQYSAISRRGIAVGAGQVIAQLAFGFTHIGSVGLLLGLVLGRLCGLGGLLSKNGLLRQGRPRGRLMLNAGKEYRRLIGVGIWSAVVNSLGIQAPLLVVGALYGQQTVGQAGLTFRVLAAPTIIIGVAVSRVCQAEMSEAVRKGEKNRLRGIIIGNAQMLFWIGLPIAGLLIAAGPGLFANVFGHEWKPAGNFARVMAVGYLAQLAVSPISHTLVLLGRQWTMLTWEISRALVTVASPVAAALAGFSALTSVAALSGSYVLSYAFLLWISLRVAHAEEWNRASECDGVGGIELSNDQRTGSTPDRRSEEWK